VIYDLIVIGSGPAGARAAISASRDGKKVALIEKYPKPGGSSVHWGTIPSKSFRESVYRWSLGSVSKKVEQPDIKRLLERRNRVIAEETRVVTEKLKSHNITLIQGHARLVSENEVEISSKRGKEKIKGEFIFIAVGARPVAPAHLPVDGKRIFDSDTILDLPEIPKSLVVLGAGIIGCEYASIFSTARTKVHLVDRRDEILASVDREIVQHLTERFREQKMEILLETQATKLEVKTHGVKVHLASGKQINTDAVLVALGRCGNIEGLGLEEVGIDRDERGLIQVDKHFRTSVPNIYAIGDVIGAPALAATGAEQGSIASSHVFGGKRAMPKNFPYGIYTIPEISMVGLTENEARSRKLDFVVGRAYYRDTARGQIIGDNLGMLKLLVDRKTSKLIGIHIMGDAAANLTHIGMAVMDLGGDITYLAKTIFNYPTLAEAYKWAAFDAIKELKSGKK
jgi:NAD(P) transhydrogenase